jgi:hypothetical protein
MPTIAAFLVSITASVAARAMFSLGFGIFSYAALTTAVTSVLASAQNYYGQIPVTTLQIINLGGIGEMLGIIAAALITNATLQAIKRLRPV